MLPTDPFKNKLRRYIPLNDFWELVDVYQAGTLKHQTAPGSIAIEQRVAELADAESKHGFVYEGELLWLQAIANGDFSASYVDWVRMIFDEFLLRSPLRWAAKELVYGTLPSSLGFNFWAGQMKSDAVKFLPFGLIPELEPTGIFAYSIPAVTVYGKRDRPSSVHLIKAFELFHNLPYYVLEHKEWLTHVPNEDNMILMAISAVDPDSPENWILDQDNDYNGGDEYLFSGREAIPHTGLVNRLIDLVEAAQDTEWLALKKRGVEDLPDRIGDRYRTNVSADHQLHLPGDRWPDRKRKTKALLSDISIRCRCGLERREYMEFAWGDCIGWRKYQLGDTIQWSQHSIGQPNLKQVFVRSRPETCCPRCNADVDDWVLCIEDNKITGFAPEFKKRVEFVFQDPFVEIDGQLINWDTCSSRQMLELFQQRLNESEHPEWPRLQAALERSIMMKQQTIAAEFCTGWLACRYRELLTEEQFWQALVIAKAMQLDNDLAFGKESAIESTGMIHRVIGDQSCWYQFRWGSLLDFPHYQLGDSIRWGDYVFGEPEIRLAFVKASRIGGFGGYCYLRIEDNRITEFIDDITIVAGEFAQYENYDAYVDGFPYHIGPYRLNQ